MKYIVYILAIFLVVTKAAAQTVSDSVMTAIYEAIKTPFKYGLVLVPQNDSLKIDCPSVFRKGKFWYMTYIVFNGCGYETYLAQSKDLLTWKSLGKTLTFNNDTTVWDAHQKAGYIALQDYQWGGSYALQTYKGNYWMSYFGGNAKGYEAGQLSLGIAFTNNNITVPHTWQTLAKPVLASTDTDVRWWENKKHYKNTVIWDKQKTTGYPFVMYYNANGDTSNNRDKKTRWFERIGMAVSNNMLHWQRFKTEPIMHHKIGITGDPMLQKIGNIWVMFYFGAFWEGRKDAFNRFACSYDLVNWTDWKGEDLIHSSAPYDAKYAHKSFVVKWKDVVYHFYNAVNNKNQRGIAVATSKYLGKSALHFLQ
ncbi:MAG: glycosylase [Flavobacterium sp.]|nr:glycosylase [Flavobacterium sp.]